jgi:hypothetical protein
MMIKAVEIIGQYPILCCRHFFVNFTFFALVTMQIKDFLCPLQKIANVIF